MSWNKTKKGLYDKKRYDDVVEKKVSARKESLVLYQQ